MLFVIFHRPTSISFADHWPGHCFLCRCSAGDHRREDERVTTDTAFDEVDVTVSTHLATSSRAPRTAWKNDAAVPFAWKDDHIAPAGDLAADHADRKSVV